MANVSTSASLLSGWLDTTGATLTFDDQSRTFTLAAESGHVAYVGGKRVLVFEDQTLTLPAAAGTYWIYVDEFGALQSAAAWDWDLARVQALVARVEWTGSAGTVTDMRLEAFVGPFPLAPVGSPQAAVLESLPGHYFGTSVPGGGDAGQVLTRTSDGGLTWTTPTTVPSGDNPDGFLLWAESAGLGVNPAQFQGYHWSWGDGGTGSADGSRTNPWGAPAGFTITRLALQLDQAVAGAGDTATVEVYVNETATGATVSLTQGNAFAVETVNIAVAQGDRVALRSIAGTGAGSSGNNANVTMLLERAVTVAINASALFQAESQLVSDPTVIGFVSALLQAEASLDAAGQLVTDVGALMQGEASLGAAGEVVIDGAALFQGEAQLVGTPEVVTPSDVVNGSALLQTEASLSAAPLVVQDVAALLEGGATLLAEPVVVIDGAATFQAEGQLDAAGQPVVDGTALLQGETQLLGTPTVETPSSFVPSDIASFWDSFTTDIDPATDDAAVTSWNADSGTASRNLDTAIADTVRANGGLDGNDTVSLETTSAQLRSDPDQITSLINSNTWEVLIVADITSASGGSGATNYWLNSFLFGDDQRTWSIAVDSGGIVKTGFFVGGDQAVQDVGIDIRSAGPVVIRAARNGADLHLQVQNRSIVTTDTGQTGSTTGSRIAVGDTGSGGLVGRLAIYAFTDFLSPGNRSSMYGYLGATYPSIVTP